MRRSDIANLPAAAQLTLETDIRAHDVYSLLAKQETPQRDFTAPPIVL